MLPRLSKRSLSGTLSGIIKSGFTGGDMSRYSDVLVKPERALDQPAAGLGEVTV
jgi:hypothetical protein